MCILVYRLLSLESLEFYDYFYKLLAKFVNDAQVLYGNKILVYNVHCLIHVNDDVKNVSCSEDFSAFIFENKLGQLKN